jgi:uncharacterized protein DUF932
MQGLTLHCGSNAATLEQVEAVPMPDATDSFSPISHIQLYQIVRKEFEAVGLKVAEEAHGLYRDGQRYFSVLKLTNGEHTDFSLAAGIRNTHDQSFAAALTFGTYVFVCDNLAFSGEILIARKHTRFIERDLPGLVNRAVGLFSEKRGNETRRIEIYKQTELTDLVMHDLMIRALDSRVVPVTKLPAVLEAWRKPPHDDFAPRTAWSGFNAFTEILKGGNAFELGRRTIKLHGLFDRLAGLDRLGLGVEAGNDVEIKIADEGGQVYGDHN